MKKTNKFIAAFFIPFIASVSLFAEDSAETKINNGYSEIAKNLNEIVIENSLAMNTTPDAYIGKLLKSIPPHFQAGFSVAATVVDTSFITNGIQNLFDEIQNSAGSEDIKGTITFTPTIPAYLPIPAASFKFRVGGLFLPFDLGGYFISTIPDTIKDISIMGYSFGLNYISAGADLRVAVMQGSMILPQVSLGAGFIWNLQDIKFGFNHELDYSDGLNEKKGHLETESSFSNNTSTIYLSAQVSKQFGITIPYFGIRGLLTSYTNEFSWFFTLYDENNSEFTDGSKKSNDKDLQQFDFSNLQAQVFGGFTLTLPFFETGVTGSYNFMTKRYAFQISTCFKM